MAACKACNDPLVFRLDESGDDYGEEEVPDDLELSCGCHFHWQCLLDQSHTIALSLKCPACSQYLPSNEPGPSSTNAFLQGAGTVILATYTSEGGTEPELDIMPSITEEAYLASHPEARPARAFHVMCSEGDVDGIVMLLSSLQENDGEDNDVLSVLHYQDPLAGDKSGLHLAVENGQEEVALLLIWLCSTAPLESFPESARRSAASNGVSRLPVGSGQDIRALQDNRGFTAEYFARQSQRAWLGFLDTGLLSTPSTSS